jgi:two-component system NarL family sensor kinase
MNKLKLKNILLLFIYIFFLPNLIFANYEKKGIDESKINAKTYDIEIHNLYKSLDKYQTLSLNEFESKLHQLKALTNQSNANDILYFHYYEILFLKEKNIDSAIQIYNFYKPKIINNYNLLFDYNLAYASLLIKKNKYQTALDTLFALLTLSEKNNSKYRTSRIKTGIGWAYMEMKQLKKAIYWFHQSLNDIKNEADDYRQEISYNNLSSCYGEQGIWDSSWHYNNLALYYGIKHNNIYSLISSYFIRADLYIYHKKDFKNAETCFNKGIELENKRNDPFYLVSNLASMSLFYSNYNKPQKALHTALQAEKIAIEHHLTAKYPFVYDALSEAYAASGDYKKQAQILKKINLIQDTLYLQNSEKALAEMNAKYESSNKQNIITKQQYEITRKNNALIIAIVFFILISFLLYFVYLNRVQKQEKKYQSKLLHQNIESTKLIIQAEENERNRIAADLHDTVGQSITAAKFNFEAFINKIQINNESEKNLSQVIKQLLDESSKEVSNVSRNMMPNALMKLGLGSAIKNFIEKLDGQKIRIIANIDIQHNIEKSTEIIVYRIIQEIVNNVIKHAFANQLYITASTDPHSLSITLEDNGVGFDLKNMKENNGIGLNNIRTRIAFLQGNVDIDSSPQKGTCITLYIPLKHNF